MLSSKPLDSYSIAKSLIVAAIVNRNFDRPPTSDRATSELFVWQGKPRPCSQKLCVRPFKQECIYTTAAAMHAASRTPAVQPNAQA